MAFSDSDDDVPLAKRSNGQVSQPIVPKSVGKAMEKSGSNKKYAPASISVRNGPVTEKDMSMDESLPNGKRKSRGSTRKVTNYKEDSEDEEIVKPNSKRQKIKAQSSESDSDAPIARRKTSKLPPSMNETALGDTDSDDEALGAKLAKKKATKEAKNVRAKEEKKKKGPTKRAIKEESDSEAEEPKKADIEIKAEKEPKSIRAKEEKKKNGPAKRTRKEASGSEAEKPKKAQRKTNGTSKKANGLKHEESDSDTLLATKKLVGKINGKVKSEPSTPSKKGKRGIDAKKEASEEEEEEDEYRWWDAPKKEDDSIKWTALQHNGVIFPPPYESLPKNVKLRYDGVPVNLHQDAEEIAGFFGAMLNSTHNVENPTFQKNFFNDFTEILHKTGGATDKDGTKVHIKEFGKLDFKAIFEYYHAKNEEKKARPTAEKKADKAAKDATESPYLYCTWDGRKEKVGNFRVEPPGLFRGRGEHPKTGKVKARVMPEQITINIGKEATVPAPPEGHQWKKVQHDNKATWLAMWQENINGAYKYVMLAANSTIKGQSDFKKFEKARELKKHIDRIRRDYEKDMKAELMADRQRATAVYLIDKFALRAGNEKDTENEAETVGCCSLKYEHVTLKPPNTVIFDFLGKDSIRFYDEVTVESQVFRNLKLFKKAPKTDGDDIFDRLNTSQLNKHLTSYMPGLSAKVFRTYNASFTMAKLLKDLEVSNASVQEKVKLYNDCNRKVAILCNHKRTVGAAHEAQMEKIGDRIKGLKYQKWRTKQMILDVDPKMKKKKGEEWFALDEDLDEGWILEHQAFLVQEQRVKIEKKFQKDNEKLVQQGEKEMKQKELEERLETADELEKKFKKENKTQKVEAEGKNPSVEKLEGAAQKIDERIAAMQLQAEDREGNKEVALGTSKINYIDPRLTVVFAKKFSVPIEKFFSKTLREKFNWAIKSVEDADDWEF